MKSISVILAIIAIVCASPSQARDFGTIGGNDFAEPGYNSTLEVKIHCERRDEECLRILEGAIGSAITMQDAYVEHYKLPPLFCLNNSPTIEDFRGVFLKYANKTADATGQDTLRSQFSGSFLGALVQYYPCKKNSDYPAAPIELPEQPDR